MTYQISNFYGLFPYLAGSDFTPTLHAEGKGKHISKFSHRQERWRWIGCTVLLSSFTACFYTDIRQERPVEKKPGKNAQPWKTVEIFAGVARGLTVSGQIWCQGARQPQQIQSSLYLPLSCSFSAFIIRSDRWILYIMPSLWSLPSAPESTHEATKLKTLKINSFLEQQ